MSPLRSDHKNNKGGFTLAETGLYSQAYNALEEAEGQ
jgi:hypothetical protein